MQIYLRMSGGVCSCGQKMHFVKYRSVKRCHSIITTHRLTSYTKSGCCRKQLITKTFLLIQTYVYIIYSSHANRSTCSVILLSEEEKIDYLAATGGRYIRYNGRRLKLCQILQSSPGQDDSIPGDWWHVILLKATHYTGLRTTQ